MKFKPGSGIESAMFYTGPNFVEVEAFVGGDAEFRGRDFGNGHLVVATPKGPLTATPRQYLVKRQDGSFFSCDYEAIADQIDWGRSA